MRGTQLNESSVYTSLLSLLLPQRRDARLERAVPFQPLDDGPLRPYYVGPELRLVVDLRYRRRDPRALEARGSIASDLSLALFYSAAKCARQVSPNSVSSSRVSPTTKLTTRDTLKALAGQCTRPARGRSAQQSKVSAFLMSMTSTPQTRRNTVVWATSRPRLAKVTPPPSLVSGHTKGLFGTPQPNRRRPGGWELESLIRGPPPCLLWYLS